MPTKFISSKTSQLYESSTGKKRKTVLIFGDEVKTKGSASDGRVKVEVRDETGYISQKHLGDKPALEVYCIDVGQGDSTFIVTPKRRKILIDGGSNRRAHGFLAWKYRLDKDVPPIDIDLLVLSHADGDHIDGLAPIIQHPKINVRKIIHSGIATFKDGAYDTPLGRLNASKTCLTTRHDTIADLKGMQLSKSFNAWKQAIADEGTPYSAVDSTTGLIDIGEPGVKIEILGPRLDELKGKPVYRWYKSKAATINGHSVVLRLTYKNVSVLFSGDINAASSKYLLEDPEIASRLDAHIFKAPHHGSNDFHRPFLDAVSPQISVISSGDDTDYGHPRAPFIGALGQASRSKEPYVFSTEIAANFVEMKDNSNKEYTEEAAPSLETIDPKAPNADALARVAYKRRLHGMINLRTDGEQIYAARRVAAAFFWEAYGEIKPADKEDV